MIPEALSAVNEAEYAYLFMLTETKFLPWITEALRAGLEKELAASYGDEARDLFKTRLGDYA